MNTDHDILEAAAIIHQLSLLVSKEGESMNELLLKLVMSFLTDENVRRLIEPIKRDILAFLEKQAASTPEKYDDILLKVVKVLFGVNA